MSITDVARRYAKALLALTRQKGVHSRALAELHAVYGILTKDESVAAYFHNPLISPEQKLQVLKKGFAGNGMLEDVESFIGLLAQRNRLEQFSSMIEAFQEGLDSEEGITRGTVRAASPLTPEALRDLETKISGSLKKKIVLTYKQDSRLLGGLVAQVGGWTFDDSLESHLQKLNEDLNRSAT